MFSTYTNGDLRMFNTYTNGDLRMFNTYMNGDLRIFCVYLHSNSSYNRKNQFSKEKYTMKYLSGKKIEVINMHY